MKVIENPHEAFAHIDHWKKQGLRIGLVPTMGALHQGHLTLVERSLQECDISAVSIFVNPTQFGPHEDFAKYPRTLEVDLDHLRKLKVDLVFTPSPAQLYPPDFSTFLEPPRSAQPLEGEFRPGHFRGVVTVVLKLFHIIPAHVSYFGQKDFQQLTVIRHMVEDLNLPMRIEGCETVREPDGLAMSSRNRYLSTSARQTALGLWRALSDARTMVEQGEREVAQIEARMATILQTAGADSIDYACIVDRNTLQPIDRLDQPSIALIAAYVEQTRLIDNLMLDPPETPLS